MAVAAFSTPAVADEPSCTETWVGPAGAGWAYAKTWSPATVPSYGDTACVVTAAGPRVTSDVRVNTLYFRDTSLTPVSRLSARRMDIASR